MCCFLNTSLGIISHAAEYLIRVFVSYTIILKNFWKKKFFFLKNKEKYEIIQYIFCSMNIGGSIRLNPCGLLTLGLFALFLMYYSFGWATNKNSHAESISIKSLLAASIDVAKRGGLEVKRIREQVSNILFF